MSSPFCPSPVRKLPEIMFDSSARALTAISEPGSTDMPGIMPPRTDRIPSSSNS